MDAIVSSVTVSFINRNIGRSFFNSHQVGFIPKIRFYKTQVLKLKYVENRSKENFCQVVNWLKLTRK